MELIDAGLMFLKVDIQSLNFNTNFEFFERNQVTYSLLNMYHWVPWNSVSNYVPIEGHKNESLTFCLRIWIWNIFPILWDQMCQNQILGKKYVSG